MQFRNRADIERYFRDNAGTHGIEMAFLFGSRVAGIEREDSDVDIAIFPSNKVCDACEEFRLAAQVEHELSLKIRKDVSVIVIHEDFRKPMLYYNAIVLGVPVYIANPREYHKLRLRAIFHMEDFSIFGTAWQLAVAERNLEAIGHG